MLKFVSCYQPIHHGSLAAVNHLQWNDQGQLTSLACDFLRMMFSLYYYRYILLVARLFVGGRLEGAGVTCSSCALYRQSIRS